MQKKKKKKLEPYLIPYTKINSRCIKDLNVRVEMAELLKVNLGLSKYFLRYGIKKVIKEKLDKFNLVKIENCCASEHNCLLHHFEARKETNFMP